LTAAAVGVVRTCRRALIDSVVLRWLVASRAAVFASMLAVYGLDSLGVLGPARYRSPLDVLGAWDGAWYRRIAVHGYLLVPDHQSDPAFFPFFPILMHALDGLGLPPVLAGALVSNVAFVVAVLAFHRLGRRLLPEPVATRATVFLVLTPMAYVFSMEYPESLLLALTVLAALAALAGNWRLTALCAALAVLTRPEGLLLVVPLAAIAWRARRELDPSARGRALAAVLAAPTALVAFMLYLKWAVGTAFAWNKAEAVWGRSFRLTGPLTAVEHVPRLVSSYPLLARDPVLLASSAALVIVAARRTSLPREWILAAALILVLPLFSGTAESEGRFALLALAVYWGAGAVALAPRLERGLRLGLLGLLAASVFALPSVWP
jgi:hypothetical protein